TTSNGSPAESIFRWISMGYALSGSRPSPAVRLVPAKSTTRRPPVAAPLDFGDWPDPGAGGGETEAPARSFDDALAPFPPLADLLDPPQPAAAPVNAAASIPTSALLLPTRAPIICSLLVTYPRNIAAATTGSRSSATSRSPSLRARSSPWSARRGVARRRSSV